MNAPRNVSYQGYVLESLKDPEEAAAYIEAVLELDDSAALLLALRQVAKAHGMAEVARRADVAGEPARTEFLDRADPAGRAALRRYPSRVERRAAR